jgi:hypothetical protein
MATTKKFRPLCCHAAQEVKTKMPQPMTVAILVLVPWAAPQQKRSELSVVVLHKEQRNVEHLSLFLVFC